MWFVDGHAHLDSLGSLHIMLEHCRANMQEASASITPEKEVHGLVLLAETSNTPWSSELFKVAPEGQVVGIDGQWQIKRTSKNILICSNPENDTLCCILGQQINSEEKIELLLFGMDGFSLEGLNIENILEQAKKHKALVILPWGVGKWLGLRGRIINQLISSYPVGSFYLGDNGNRPFFWQNIPQFSLAKKKKISILRGSDPIGGTPQQLKRVGAFGSIVQQSLNFQDPLHSLQESLLQGSLTSYGACQGLFSFLLTQTQLRL